MKKQLSVILAAVGFAAGISTASADQYIDVAPLIRDVDAGFAGPETIMPYFDEGADTNADGTPDTLAMYFNVYQGGTTTKIRKTTTKTINLPAVPCTAPDPNSIDSSWTPKFLGRVGSTREHMLINYYVSCNETPSGAWKEAYKTIVYSADLATGTGVWTYAVGRFADGLNGVDLDGDGVNESLMLFTETQVTAGMNAVIRIMTGSNGALVSEVTYPVVR
jgi:hypothetical protein